MDGFAFPLLLGVEECLAVRSVRAVVGLQRFRRGVLGSVTAEQIYCHEQGDFMDRQFVFLSNEYRDIAWGR